MKNLETLQTDVSLKTKAELLLQQQSAPRPRPVDPRDWWEELLERERKLQQRESLMTSPLMTFKSAAWDSLHRDSEQLCRDLAACQELLKEVR